MAETDPFVLRKICHAIGKASGDWKGLVEALVNALVSPPALASRSRTSHVSLCQPSALS